MLYITILVIVFLSALLIYREIYSVRVSKKERTLWLADWQIKKVIVAQENHLGTKHEYRYKQPADNQWKNLPEAFRENAEIERSFIKFRLK